MSSYSASATVVRTRDRDVVMAAWDVLEDVPEDTVTAVVLLEHTWAISQPETSAWMRSTFILPG
jgi:hypothetical protein